MFHKCVFTDIGVDGEGRYGGVIAVKYAERDRMHRGRPPDPEFDEALLAELQKRSIPLGYGKACIQTAIEVAEKLTMNISPDGARSRVVELLRMAKGRRRRREK
jgi:hypothetical protein